MVPSVVVVFVVVVVIVGVDSEVFIMGSVVIVVVGSLVDVVVGSVVVGVPDDNLEMFMLTRVTVKIAYLS